VRNEGDKVAVTFKKHVSMELGGAQEIEFTVSSFDKAHEFFKAIGMNIESDQETRRETWNCQGCEVVLDEWPWLKPYIEIEGPSEESIKSVAAQLGFDWNEAVFGSVMQAYREEYKGIGENETIGELAAVRFADPVPQWLEDRREAKETKEAVA
jgi:adenylate cyclase class 2